MFCSIGNKPLLPEKPFGAATPGKRSAGAKKSVEAGNLIMYNGAMLDIASMVQRLDKSEKTKHETDDKLKDLQEEMGEWYWMLYKSFWKL